MIALSVLLAGLQLAPSKNLAFMATETKSTILLCAIGYVVVIGAWAALNAWGLRRRSRLAHWSSCAFAVVQIASCFGWVFGVGLFFLLFKKEMKGHYDARIES